MRKSIINFWICLAAIYSSCINIYISRQYIHMHVRRFAKSTNSNVEVNSILSYGIFIFWIYTCNNVGYILGIFILSLRIHLRRYDKASNWSAKPEKWAVEYLCVWVSVLPLSRNFSIGHQHEHGIEGSTESSNSCWSVNISALVHIVRKLGHS